MAQEQISEQMTGTVDGSNTAFNTSQIPAENTIAIYVDDVPVTIASVDPNDPTKFILAAAPASGHRPFAVYLYSAPDDVDLVTVATVKAIGQITGDKEDNQIQDLITAFSNWVIWRTGGCKTHNRILVITDDDPYDGRGGQKLWLRNYPIISVQTCLINGRTMPIASGRTDGGIVIVNDHRAIALRPPCGTGFSSFQSYPLGVAAYQFTQGIANIYVDYTAGNAVTPPDLEGAAAEQVAIEYKRKAWFDLKSKSQAVGGGSSQTTFRDWHLTPKVQKILDAYTRMSL